MTPNSFLDPEMTLNGETLALSGIITHKTVMKIWQEGLALIKNRVKHPVIDLGGLSQCDSSGLALCTAWGRVAHQEGKNIVFINVPIFIQDLLRVYGLDKVLTIKKGATR